jgi:hypothetical protein
MMLGPACPFNYEVPPMEYLEEACEWFPEEGHGWAASFTGDDGAAKVMPDRTLGWALETGGVRPALCFPWKREAS